MIFNVVISKLSCWCVNSTAFCNKYSNRTLNDKENSSSIYIYISYEADLCISNSFFKKYKIMFSYIIGTKISFLIVHINFHLFLTYVFSIIMSYLSRPLVFYIQQWSFDIILPIQDRVLHIVSFDLHHNELHKYLEHHLVFVTVN